MKCNNIQKLQGITWRGCGSRTDDQGECINPYVRVGISIEITKPLEKMIFLEREDDNEVKLPVMCKRFLDL